MDYFHINQPHKSYKNTPISDCEQSRSAWVDLIILIAVITSLGFLIYPSIALLLSSTLEILKPIELIIQEELSTAPTICACLLLSIFSASIAVLAITLCASQKCDKPGCRGLHEAAEFDIHLETEDCIKNLNSSSNYGLKKGLFELPRDYLRELEAELKKMAPVNGRAVLVFRAGCGCCVGRFEVLGSKKNRRIKK